MPRVLWPTRKFNFDFPHELYPEILERLYGTPILLENLIDGIAPDILTKKQGERWSIQENAGHLIEVESLWYSRIDDILSGDVTMRAADMSNTKTYQANYNERDINDMVDEFRAIRKKFTDRLQTLSEDDFGRSAHPSASGKTNAYSRSLSILRRSMTISIWPQCENWPNISGIKYD